ncbi:peptide chain release factor 1 [Hypoxylon texense]
MDRPEPLTVKYAAFAALVVCAGLLARAIVKGFRTRLMFYRLRQHGMPMPPWNPVLGHLAAILPVMNTLPKNRQQPDTFKALCRAYKKKNGDSVIYVNM